MESSTPNIQPILGTQALEERYLSYALSTILSRSLPDVRDGLKPVHRRLLYAMRELKLNPGSHFKKSARIVGDVIGKYHPHGDVAVYETLVRLAQDFSLRYPLIEGQGNFGNIDGDNPAAMRYTESRLTPLAEFLMDGLSEDAVDFRPNYDGSEEEPIVFPALFPNLLANGSNGIAVGMATSIPPHNLAELLDALILLIQKPESTNRDLCAFVQGPDFPTGGLLVEDKENIISSYETGKGSFRLRAAYEVETLKNGLYQIVVTQIPYQIQKSKLIQKIASLIDEKKNPFLADIRDESSEDIRLILLPKTKQIDPIQLMESLFKSTELEIRYSLNMNVVDGVSPKLMSLKDVLTTYLRHRLDVLIRMTGYRLKKVDGRLEVLNGFLIAYLNLDEVIKIIREEDHPKEIMMKKWDLTDIQAEAILNMRLRSLRKLEELEIKKEIEGLSLQKEILTNILSSPRQQMKEIETDFKKMRKLFGENTALGKRRTLLDKIPDVEILTEDQIIEKEPITVVFSEKGWVRALKGHAIDKNDIKYKESDSERFLVESQTTDRLIFFSNLGKSYSILGDKLPKGRGFGDAINLLFDLKPNEEIISLFVHEENQKYLACSESARGFLVDSSDLIASTKLGKNILSLHDGEIAVICKKATEDWLAVIAENRKLLIFQTQDIPQMQKGKGVILQKIGKAKIMDLMFLNPELGMKWKAGERTRYEADLKPWLGKRAQAGRLAPIGFPRSNRFDEIFI